GLTAEAEGQGGGRGSTDQGQRRGGQGGGNSDDGGDGKRSGAVIDTDDARGGKAVACQGLQQAAADAHGRTAQETGSGARDAQLLHQELADHVAPAQQRIPGLRKGQGRFARGQAQHGGQYGSHEQRDGSDRAALVDQKTQRTDPHEPGAPGRYMSGVLHYNLGSR